MHVATEMPHASLTDVGRRRDHNEDSLYAAPPILAVADGVGGSAKGEVASERALEAFVAAAAEIPSAKASTDAVAVMERAVLAANRAVHEAQLGDESLRGMATTLTAAVVRDGGEIIVGHVGDSRLYVLSAAGARMATQDHSVVAELVRSGKLDVDQVPHHPQRNVITRALGPEPDVSVDSFVLHVGPGDWLLVCSDGLTEHVTDPELAGAVLEHPRDPATAVRALVDLANERGGTDNISVVIAQPVPSDVSGELTIEALHAAAATTAQLRRTDPSDAPAEQSGPLPVVIPPNAGDGTTTDELPQMQPIDHPEDDDDWSDSRGALGRRGWALLALFVVLAAIAGSFVWSQSYFLVERADGRVGINRGFPISRLATPSRSSDIVADELSKSDRERLVDSHRILSRSDAERVLNELPQRLEPTSQEAQDGNAARP